MLNLERSRSVSRHDDPNGDEYTLVSERLSLSVGGGHVWLGAGYNRPVAVIRNGRVRPLYDVVFLVRLAALLSVAVAGLVGVIRR